MPNRRTRPALFVFGLIAVLALGTTTTFARTPRTAAASVAADGGFDCGTRADDRGHAFAQYHRYRAMKDDVARGAASLLPSADFVYDDVWVVEDDGTILLSGTNAFDTPANAFHFVPAAGGYHVSAPPLFFDLTPGVDLALADDGASLQALPFAFHFYGVAWNDVWVGANGALGFGANPDPSGFFDANDFWSATPKITPLFADLDPSDFRSDGVYFRATADSVVITWKAIYEYGVSRANTFQVILRSDDTFEVIYAGIQTTTATSGAPVIAGITPGGTSPTMERISFSSGVPHTGLPAAGIYEDYYSLANPQVNEPALLHRFYSEFPDSFFQVVFFTNFAQTMPGFANEVIIENSITGIGRDPFDNTALYGSAGVLESRCNMNQIAAWPYTDPNERIAARKNNSFLTIMGQESGHRWGAFVRFLDANNQVSNMILGRSDAHWSYYLDIDHSCLEGGNWEETAPGSYVCPSSVDFFSQIDEYLMGLRTPEEVAPTYYISSATNDQDAARSVGTPIPGATAFGTPVPVTIESIIAAEGERTTATPDEEHDLRQAFILVLKNGTTASQADLDKIAGFRRSWENYFEVSCDGRLTVNTRLHQQWPVAVMQGHVVDRLTDQPVAHLDITSVERNFVQAVPAGGRYMFRYQASETSTLGWASTLEVSAPGYYPETIHAQIPYGYTFDHDIELDPVPTSVATPSRPLPSTLYQNFPNPFNPATTIPYDVAARSRVKLTVVDAAGRTVRTLVDGVESAGHKRVEWNGTDDGGRRVASGIYFCRVQIGEYRGARKMILIK